MSYKAPCGTVPTNDITQETLADAIVQQTRNSRDACQIRENAHLLAILKHFGHEASLFELEGFDHVNVLSPA